MRRVFITLIIGMMHLALLAQPSSLPYVLGSSYAYFSRAEIGRTTEAVD